MGFEHDVVVYVWHWWHLSTRSVTEETGGKEKLVLQEECELVTVMEVVKGQLEVTTSHIYFFDHTPSRETGETLDLKWQLAELREIHFRRYNLRRSALEFFFVDQSNCFINFQKEVKTAVLAFRLWDMLFNRQRADADDIHAYWVCCTVFFVAPTNSQRFTFPDWSYLPRVMLKK